LPSSAGAASTSTRAAQTPVARTSRRSEAGAASSASSGPGRCQSGYAVPKRGLEGRELVEPAAGEGDDVVDGLRAEAALSAGQGNGEIAGGAARPLGAGEDLVVAVDGPEAFREERVGRAGGHLHVPAPGEQGRQVARQLEIKDGNIALPEAPGLGVEIDEAALAKYPYRQFDKRAFRTYRDEGP